MTVWNIVTGEYPPQPGGVSDYTRLVARGLVGAGDSVHVWTVPSSGTTPCDVGVEVHRLPDHFGPRSLVKLGRWLKNAAQPSRLLVQYVPHAFGWKALNVPFCIWLWSRRRRDSIWVMFHEVHFPTTRRQPVSHNLLGVATRLMASLVASSAVRIFVSIPAWKEVLKSVTSNRTEVTWIPVPNTIPVVVDPSGVAILRARYAPEGAGFVIGHFGTYAGHITNQLNSLLPRLLICHADRVAVLIGRGSEVFRDDLIRLHPDVTERVFATGSLSAGDISRHLGACDLIIQPFGDGVSSRRTSVMTALEHGLPIVTTDGPLTEPLWAESEAVSLSPAGDITAQAQATEYLLVDAQERKRLGNAAVKLYRERFDLRHTIAALCNAAGPESS